MATSWGDQKALVIMSNTKVPNPEIEVRLQGLQERLASQSLDGAFIVQRADLYYLSGCLNVDYMFIPSEGQPVLFFLVEPSANVASMLTDQCYTIDGSDELQKILKRKFATAARRIGLELDIISYNEFRSYGEFFDGAEIFDVSPLILDLRSRKSDWELERMKDASKITARLFDEIRSLVGPGISEMELAAEAEAYAQGLGNQFIDIRVRDYKTEGYPWHILSGENGGMLGLLDSPASGQGSSAAFPCGASQKLIRTKEPIMVDFAYELDGYHVDETRMFSIGPMPDDGMRASEAAIKIHNYVLDHVRAGVRAGDLFDYSVSKAHELGYEDSYLGPIGYKVSFVGHGIGTELIEWPLIAKGREDMLEPGMTFALEPKIVFKDQFIAGVESVVAVTEDGFELISKVPVEVFIC